MCILHTSLVIIKNLSILYRLLQLAYQYAIIRLSNNEGGKTLSEIQNKEGLAYELGVLMFNIVTDHEDSLAFTNDYDGMGNFISIINAVGCIEMEEMEGGFVSECENYDIPEEEAKKLFAKTVEKIDQY